MVPVQAHLLGHLAVNLEHPLLAVEGDEEPGPGEGVDDFQFLLAGVAGDMEHVRPVVDDLHALAEQLVDDPAHRHLVAGDGGGGDDHLVPGADFHLLVGGEGHAVQGAHLLALGPGGDDDLLVFRQALDFADVHQGVLGHLHIAQFRGHPHDVLHGPARDGHLPPVGGGGVQHLLDAVDVGGEGRHNNALVAALELAHEGLSHRPLAHGVARAFHVGGVGAEGQHAPLAQLTQPGQVDDLPVNGGGVNFKVPGVDHGAHMGVDGESHGVGNGVVHMDELHSELSRPDGLAGLHSDELGALGQAVLLQLQLDEPGGKTGAVDGQVYLLEDIGNGSHVVLVAVGDEEAPDAGTVFDQVGHVGDDAVNAIHVVPGEGHAAVHHDEFPAVLVSGHVFSDLIEAAQRDDFQFFCHSIE